MNSFKRCFLFCFDRLRRSLANHVSKYLGYNKDQLQVMLSTYSLYQFRKISSEKRVICVWKKGGSDATGLADRIKGMVSSYILADIYGYKFYTYHNHGFVMQDYLEPNEVDWPIDISQVSMGLNRFKIIWNLRQLPKLDTTVNEYHTHRTVDLTQSLPQELAEKYAFHKVFHKLFKPSERLKSMIAEVMNAAKLISNQFVAVHVRFLDFFENVEQLRESAYSRRGTQQEQQEMLASVKKTIEIIKETRKVERILLLSDSSTFLSQDFPNYVCILPGKVGHIQAHVGICDVVDKTFTDMFVMAEAKEIININGTNIYNSDFCRIGALIGNKPFSRVARIMAPNFKTTV